MRPKNPGIVAVLDAFQAGIISRRLALRRLEAIMAAKLDEAHAIRTQSRTRTAEELQYANLENL